MARLAAEQRAAEVERVFLGGMRHLVDEGLDEEAVPRRLDAAPRAGRDVGRDLGGAHALIGDAVDDVGFAAGAVVCGVVVDPGERAAFRVERARQIAPGRVVEVEVENIEEFRTALIAGADIIMLDEFTESDMREAVAINQGQAQLEVSGGVTHATIDAIAASGVDFVSIGEITKRVEPIDLSMRFEH